MSHGAPNLKAGSALLKAVIVAFLVGAMLLLHRFGGASEGFDPTGMLAFGFVVLASYTIGQLAGTIGLPHLIGYILTGIALGPSVAGMLPESWHVPPFDKGILNHEVQAQLGLLDALAVALIALSAGGELKLDTLRRGFRHISGLMAGHAIVTFILVFIFGWLISGRIPSFQLDPLAKLDTAGVLAMAGLLATFAMCTSPTVAIAVVNGIGARGPFTRLTLSSVVLIDVPVAIVFSIAGTIASDVLGISTTEGSIGMYLLVHVAGSLAVGAVIGVLISLYLRFVGKELFLFIIGISYTASYVAKELHLSPLLLFVAAGFVCANFSKTGDKLIENVEHISLPVYVVFFTLTGAHLDLEVFRQAAVFVVALAAVRLLGIYLGVRAGARLSGAGATAEKLAWTSFVSQAGVALSLAALIGNRYGEAGVALSAMMVGCIAVNELAGAIIFKTGLVLAGEAGKAGHGEAGEGAHAEHAPAEQARKELEPWPEVQPIEEPLGPALSTQSEKVNLAVRELEQGLEAMIAGLRESLIARFRNDADRHLRDLGREFLRHHRRISGSTVGDPRRELAHLAAEWRRLTLERADQLAASEPEPAERAANETSGDSRGRIHSADNRPRSWSATFEQTFAKIDALVDAVPAEVRAPHELASYVARPEDSIWRRMRRIWLQTQRGARSLFGLSPPSRRVALRDLVRYHLEGRAPARLEAVAATLFQGDVHLGRRSALVFAAIAQAYSGGAKDPAAIRRSVEEQLLLARQELERICESAHLRLLEALGGALREIKRDLPVMSTFELGDRARRYSLVFADRARAIETLTRRLAPARANVAAEYRLIALELELQRIEVQVTQAIETHGRELERMISGRGRKQLERVGAELETALSAMEKELDAQPRVAGAELAARIRRSALQLARVAGDAAHAAGELSAQLAEESTITPILDTLLGATTTLAERYSVPSAPIGGELSSVGAPVPLVEIPFRSLVAAYVETSIAKRLLDLTHDFADKVRPASGALSEIERIVSFNAELAGAELDVFGEGDDIPDATRTMVREMLLGPLGRAKTRLAQLVEASGTWSAELERGIQSAVQEELLALRKLVLGGKTSKLELRVLREVAQGRRMLRGAGDLRSVLQSARSRAAAAAKSAIGEQAFESFQRALGWPSPETSLAEAREVLRASSNDVERLPIVYRRLFTEHALQAGDLLTGRSAEVARANRVLSRRDEASGPPRAVAIVGRSGVGKSAVINAIARSLGPAEPVRVRIEHPVSEETVVSWFDPSRRDQLVIVEGLENLFAMRAGGFGPLARFVTGVVEDRGRNRWIAGATSPVWGYASRASPLAAAFPEVIELHPSSVEAMSSALLARHQMSGYQLRFQTDDTLGSRIARPFLARRASDAEWMEREWFRTLHAITSGVIRDALRLWLASVKRVDEENGIVELGAIPRPPLAALRALPEDMLLAAMVAMRQGWIDGEVLGEVFRFDRLRASAELGRLEHVGVIETVPPNGEPSPRERYRLPVHLEGPLHRVLEERGWIA